MSERDWRIYLVMPLEDGLTHDYDEENREIVKLIYGFFERCWWNHYGSSIRFGVFSELGVKEQIEKLLEEAGFQRRVGFMINPDYEDYGIELAGELNRLKELTAKIIHDHLNCEIPPSKLEPNWASYFLHLMMNQLGMTYREELLTASLICYNSARGIQK